VLAPLLLWALVILRSLLGGPQAAVAGIMLLPNSAATGKLDGTRHVITIRPPICSR
jgi:hypothetical protein